MENSKPSWFKYLDKSNKQVTIFPFPCFEDIDYIKQKYSEELGNYHIKFRVKNAMFLEIRESGKWKGYTEVIKWLKSEKRKLSVTAKQSIVLYPTEHTRVLYRDIKTYSNLIKRFRKERLNLLRKYGE